MSKPIKTKVFKSGNSLAVRLPKALGAVEGTEMLVRETQGTYVFEPLPPTKKTIDLTGIAGSIPWLKLLTPEDRELEDRELDWTGKRLKGG